ncbi:MAG: hypothetical protein ACJAVN_001012 [Roseivirga sp.]|jgi:hypothetical protein
MQKQFSLLCLFIFFSSCDSTDQVEKGLVEFDLDQLTTATLSSDFDLIKIVQLNSNDVLIGSIKNVEVAGDEIFILDGLRTNGIYKFSLDGDYLGKIGAAGNGPGEYGTIENFAIDDNRILVVDSEKRKVDLYSRDGSFTSTLSRDVFGLDIMAIPNDEFVIYSGNSTNKGLNKKLFFFNDMGEISSSIQAVNLNQAGFLNITPQKVFSRNGLYLEPFSDKIFDLSKGQFDPVYKLSFGKNTLKQGGLDGNYDNIMVFLNAMREKNYAMLFSEFFETDNTLSFSFEYGGVGKRHHVFINKDSLTYSMFSSYIEDYLTTGLQIEKVDFKLVGSTSEYFIFMIDSNTLANGEAQFNDLSMDVDDNPVLMFMKLKQ